jgi:hypothetical protein
MTSSGSLSVSLGKMEDCAKMQIDAKTKRVFTTAFRNPWLLRKWCFMLKSFSTFIQLFQVAGDSTNTIVQACHEQPAYISELPGVWTSVWSQFYTNLDTKAVGETRDR